MVVSTLRPRTMRALFAGAVFDQISHSVGVIFTPLYLGALGAGPALVGVVIGVTTFANPLIILSAGSLVEQVPPRRLIVATRVMVATALLLAVIAQTWWQLAPALAVIAAGSLAYPAVSRAIADATLPQDRARAFSLVYGVGSNLALIVAPALGGVVAESVGLRWVYLVALVLELFSIACFLGIESTPTRHSRPPHLSYRAVLAYRPVVAISLFLFVALVILSAGLALLPTYLYDERDLSVGTIGRLGSLSGVGGMLLALGLARTRRRVSVAAPLIVSLAVLPIAFVLLIVSPQLWVIALACLISGAYLMVWPLVDAAVGSIAPERVRGRSFAFSEVCGGSGVALGPMLAGVLYDRDPQLPLVVALTGTVLILLPVMLVLRGYFNRAQVVIELEDEQALQRSVA